MKRVNPEYALRISAIADMVTGLTAAEAARTLASAVITVAKDRCGNDGDEFASNVIEMIEEGMNGENLVVVHKSEVTQ